MKRIVAILCLIAWLLAGCSGVTPTPQGTANPDAALLAGTWEQFIAMDSMPVRLVLDPSGSAVVGEDNGRWRLSNGLLIVRQGSQEDRYSYTVSGYMMTLYNVSTDTSEFYINPDAFAAGANDNKSLEGQWGAWSTFSMMSFDGENGLDSIEYTTAGRADLQQTYVARDGILQARDSDGNCTYNLYSFSGDGALLLAETSDMDNETKQWTSYWKKAEPPTGLLGNWDVAFHTSVGDEGLPDTLQFNADGTGRYASAGSVPAGLKWEYYAGGFAVLQYSQTNLQYVYVTQQGGTLALQNPEVDDGWYFDTARYKPSPAPLAAIIGRWQTDDGAMTLTFKENGTVETNSETGGTKTFVAEAQDGLMKLTEGTNTSYLAYTVEDDTIKIYYGQVSFLDQAEMPVTLTKAKS